MQLLQGFSATQEILGTNNWKLFIIWLFFAMVGVAIHLLFNSTTNYQGAVNTPNKFSIKFLLLDNWKRIALNLLLIYASLRFWTQLTGLVITSWGALLAGLGFDKIAQLLKKFTNVLDVDRSKIDVQKFEKP